MIRSGRILTLAVLVLLGACTSLTKREPFTTYSPRYTPPSATAGATRVDWQLAIDTPFASDMLATTRMLVMPAPGAIETYKSGRWADTAPIVLRTLLIEAFQTSGRIAGVGAVASGLHGDFVLSIDLYASAIRASIASLPRARSRPKRRSPARRPQMRRRRSSKR
jgi:cholesterol transport system auxiliary component